MFDSRLESVLKSFTYKPGFEFELPYSSDHHTVLVRLVAKVPDVENPSELTKVIITGGIPIWELDIPEWEERFLRHLYEMIVDFEHHEIDEWFRINKKRRKNPHKNNPSIPKRHEEDL